MNQARPEIDYFSCGTCEVHARRFSRRAFLGMSLGAAAGIAAGITTYESIAQAQFLREFEEKITSVEDYLSPVDFLKAQRALGHPTLRPAAYQPTPLQKEITGYGMRNDPRGNIEFTYSMIVPAGQRGSEPAEWQESFRTLHGLAMEKCWEEYERQFTRSAPRMGKVIDLKDANNKPVDITTIPNMSTLWALAQQSGELPEPTPGKKTVHVMAISVYPETSEELGKIKSPLVNLNWGGGLGFASMDAMFLSRYALARSIRSLLTLLHEAMGHGWTNMVHVNMDTQLNPQNDPNLGEVPGNIWAGGIKIVDGYRELKDWHVRLDQRGKINVGPDSVITGTRQGDPYRTFLSNIYQKVQGDPWQAR